MSSKLLTCTTHPHTYMYTVNITWERCAANCRAPSDQVPSWNSAHFLGKSVALFNCWMHCEGIFQEILDDCLRWLFFDNEMKMWKQLFDANLIKNKMIGWFVCLHWHNQMCFYWIKKNYTSKQTKYTCMHHIFAKKYTGLHVHSKWCWYLY